MFQNIVYSLANRQGLFAYVRTCKTRLDTTTKFMVVVTSLFNLVYHHSLTTCSIMYEHGCRFIMMVRTTLFKSVRSSSREHSVPTCMNKPVNNHVQAGQFNHVQVCQQYCSSWPVQPCSSLSTTLFKLASSTMFKPVNRQKQAVCFYLCTRTLMVKVTMSTSYTYDIRTDKSASLVMSSGFFRF